MSLRPFWHSTVGLWRSKTHVIIGIFMTIITVLSMSFHTLICPAFILVQSRVRSGQEDVSSAWTYFLVWVRLLQWLKWGGGRGNGGGVQPPAPIWAHCNSMSPLALIESTSTTTTTIFGDACPLSCASAEAYKLAQCTKPQGWGS